MKKVTLKQAEAKYERSAKDKREDKRGAEKIMREANSKKPAKAKR